MRNIIFIISLLCIGCAHPIQYCGVDTSPIVKYRPIPISNYRHETQYTGIYYAGTYYMPVCYDPKFGVKYWEAGLPTEPVK